MQVLCPLYRAQQKPLQHCEPLLHNAPEGLQLPPFAASPLFASPKQANAIPARPTLNFFSAARRVTD